MAQAILLREVPSLGEAGEVVEVSSGYLRNYLAPRGLAQMATKGAVEDARRRLEAAERVLREQEARSEEIAALLAKTVLTIGHQAGPDGRLFGSVSAREIAEAIAEARGISIDPKRVRLEQPIREVGTFLVEVEVPGGRIATIKTIVTEGG